MSQLTRDLIRPGIPASLSGPPVLSVVLRAMDPGCHKRNVPDLSRMSTHYHVPLTIHCHTLPHITTCHLQYNCHTNFSTTIFGMSTHITTCYTRYIATYVTLLHNLSFNRCTHTTLVHICTCHTRLTSVCMYTIFFAVVIFEKNGRDRATFCAGTS